MVANQERDCNRKRRRQGVLSVMGLTIAAYSYTDHDTID